MKQCWLDWRHFDVNDIYIDFIHFIMNIESDFKIWYFEKNWNSNWNWIEMNSNWNRIEMNSNWNWIELKTNWNWIRNQFELKSIWNEFKTNLYWNIQFWFEIEYEVETVLKMNLKRFIKHVLNWNRRSIYYIYYIYYIYNIMAWIERAAPRQFVNFDHLFQTDITGDPTVGFS